MKRVLRVIPSFVSGMAGALCVLLLAGAKPTPAKVTPGPQVLDSLIVGDVYANTINLTDGVYIRVNGKIVASLTANAEANNKGVSLDFYDPKGTDRMFLGIQNSRPGIAVWDAANKTRFAVVERDDGGSVLTVNDANGSKRVLIGQTELQIKSSGVMEKTKPGIVIFDEAGGVVWQSH